MLSGPPQRAHSNSPHLREAARGSEGGPPAGTGPAGDATQPPGHEMAALPPGRAEALRAQRGPAPAPHGPGPGVLRNTAAPWPPPPGRPRGPGAARGLFSSSSTFIFSFIWGLSSLSPRKKGNARPSCVALGGGGSGGVSHRDGLQGEGAEGN